MNLKDRNSIAAAERQVKRAQDVLRKRLATHYPHFKAVKVMLNVRQIVGTPGRVQGVQDDCRINIRLDRRGTVVRRNWRDVEPVE